MCLGKDLLVIEITFVWASRDDNYAGGAIVRLGQSIRNIQKHASRSGLNVECLIVDWNPPVDGDLPLALARMGVGGVRVVRVPAEAASVITDMEKRPFVEYPAKNVGIVRALGQQIAVVNSDVVLSRSAFLAIVNRPFLDASFLRLDRTDFQVKKTIRLLPKFKVLTQIHHRHGDFESEPIADTLTPLRFAPRGSKLLAGESQVGAFIVGPPGGIPSHFLKGMHTNAAGDFIATSRMNWLAVGGFSEERWLSAMGDSLVVARMVGSGLRQVILPGVGHLMHQEHERQEGHGGKWSEDMWPEFRAEIMGVATGPISGAPRRFGFQDIKLPEVHI